MSDAIDIRPKPGSRWRLTFGDVEEVWTIGEGRWCPPPNPAFFYYKLNNEKYMAEELTEDWKWKVEEGWAEEIK